MTAVEYNSKQKRVHCKFLLTHLSGHKRYASRSPVQDFGTHIIYNTNLFPSKDSYVTSLNSIR